MKKEQPRITVRMSSGVLEPATPYDAEMLAQCSGGTAFSLLPLRDRSPEHHKMYWSILGKVVKATGRWPTSEHLHRELKIACGYYQVVASEFGGVYYFPDSIALDKMDQQEFNTFFEAVMQKLSEAIGFDPMELLNDR
jgi:hypothetical protein